MNKIKDIFWLTVGAAVFGSFIYVMGKRFLINHIPKDNIRYVKAVIINVKNWDPNDRVHSDYHYSYSFTVDGKTYVNDSNDPSFKVGDSIEIEYNKNYPSLNKPVDPKE